jgi:hypothetical protein
MATMTERRRRMTGPAITIEELFEQLDSIGESEREELLFERAHDELKTGKSRRGMYAMALTSAEGDKTRASAHYMQTRVTQLASEFESWETERKHQEEQDDRKAEASADFVKTIAAVALLVFAVIAIMSWS